MPKAKRTRKFALVKRMISANDPRLKQAREQSGALTKPYDRKGDKGDKGELKDGLKARHVEKADPSLFFTYNTSLGPPYHIIVDTNFINVSIQNKIDVVRGMMDCLLAKCIPCITDCVMAELEKLGSKYRLALRLAKDPRFERLPCTHKGTYADDCIVNRVNTHKCYIVATCDKDLKRRLRKVPGVPIMYLRAHRYSIERMPDALGAPRE